MGQGCIQEEGEGQNSSLGPQQLVRKTHTNTHTHTHTTDTHTHTNKHTHTHTHTHTQQKKNTHTHTCARVGAQGVQNLPLERTCWNDARHRDVIQRKFGHGSIIVCPSTDREFPTPLLNCLAATTLQNSFRNTNARGTVMALDLSLKYCELYRFHERWTLPTVMEPAWHDSIWNVKSESASSFQNSGPNSHVALVL